MYYLLCSLIFLYVCVYIYIYLHIYIYIYGLLCSKCYHRLPRATIGFHKAQQATIGHHRVQEKPWASTGLSTPASTATIGPNRLP